MNFSFELCGFFCCIQVFFCLNKSECAMLLLLFGLSFWIFFCMFAVSLSLGAADNRMYGINVMYTKYSLQSYICEHACLWDSRCIFPMIAFINYHCEMDVFVLPKKKSTDNLCMHCAWIRDILCIIIFIYKIQKLRTHKQQQLRQTQNRHKTFSLYLIVQTSGTFVVFYVFFPLLWEHFCVIYSYIFIRLI